MRPINAANFTPDQIRELISELGTRLFFLEQRRARLGYSTPPEDLAEIQHITEEMEDLRLYLEEQAETPALSPSPRPSPPTSVSAYCLVIGIAQYSYLNPLSKTTTDAHDIHRLLVNCGYPQENAVLLVDDQATKAAISSRLDWLARRADPHDTVVLFFSGHGLQCIGGLEPGEYLCPIGADLREIGASCISDGELTRSLRAIRAGRVIVLLDACHAGGVGQPRDTDVRIKGGLSGAAYARLATGHGRVIIASCKPDELSWELPDMRNGLFTHHLLEGLRGAAADDDGAVRIFGLFDYVSGHVSAQMPQQHPLFKGEVDLNLVITLGQGVMRRP
jgi:uncharacterized caspase-like protein